MDLFAYFLGNRWKSFTVAQLRDDDEVHGHQAGAGAKNMQSSGKGEQ